MTTILWTAYRSIWDTCSARTFGRELACGEAAIAQRRGGLGSMGLTLGELARMRGFDLDAIAPRPSKAARKRSTLRYARGAA